MRPLSSTHEGLRHSTRRRHDNAGAPSGGRSRRCLREDRSGCRRGGRRGGRSTALVVAKQEHRHDPADEQQGDEDHELARAVTGLPGNDHRRLGRVMDQIESYMGSVHARPNIDDQSRTNATCYNCHDAHYISPIDKHEGINGRETYERVIQIHPNQNLRYRVSCPIGKLMYCDG